MRSNHTVKFPPLSDLDEKTRKVLEQAFIDINEQFKNIHSDLNTLQVVYTETDPNNALKGERGKFAIYKDGATYYLKQNVDGQKNWQTL